MEAESGVPRSMIDELISWDIQVDKTEGESGVSRSIIDELHYLAIQGDQMEGESVVLQVSLMNFILRISKDIKWKVKVALLELSLTNLFLGYRRRSYGR